MDRLSSSAANPREPLAIVGIGCRLPGNIDGPTSYWQRVCEGFDAICPVPADRWDSRLYYSKNLDAPRRIAYEAGGFLSQDLAKFDARFFGIAARDAAALDPQQRLLLEVTWECLEDALVVPKAIEGSNTGVFIGALGMDYGLIQHHPLNIDLVGANAIGGATQTMIAARLSYAFDLHGPCVAMDTACSASLVAFHYACQSIWNGECEAALAGGANIILDPASSIPPSKGRFFSPDSRSRAFDADANGYGRGEGVGVVLLRPLSTALERGERIYALVRASGVNHDGRTAGVALPNGSAQAELLKRVHALAGGERVQYIEAHGTGTPLGDPTELSALSEGLGLSAGAPVFVGSVKSSIGHLEAAAGIAGVIKAALAIYHAKIPPHVGIRTPNPKIEFDKLGVRVPEALLDWPSATEPRRAGVNSFGYGGTNAHVVLEQAPQVEVPAGDLEASEHAGPLFLALSARDPRALNQVAERMLHHVRTRAPALTDLVHTCVRHRSHHHHRMALTARSLDELKQNLEAVTSGAAATGVVRGEAPYGQSPSLVFVYTGMGPQTWTMGTELRKRFPVFGQAFTECLEMLSDHSGRSLFAVLEANRERAETPDPAHAQWLNFALQIALTRLWESWGVVPDVLIGHSVGELPAAYAAGSLGLEDATLIAFHRGRLQATLEGTGSMLAVEQSREGFHGLQLPGIENCEIAAFNAPTSLTIAGPTNELERLQEALDERGIFSRRVRVRVPYHSRVMDGVREEFIQAIAKIAPRAPTRTLISTVTGNAAPLQDPAYWYRNIREPVQFESGVAATLIGKDHVFLQIGPHPVLSPSLKASIAARHHDAPVLHSLHREQPEPDAAISALGSLYTSGVSLAWDDIVPRARKLFDLPHYPWQRHYHWQETEASRIARLGPNGHVLLAQRQPAATPVWHTDLTEGYFEYLRDHRLEGRPIFPAAAYLEIGVALQALLRGNQSTRLENIQFHAALMLRDDLTDRIEVRFDPDESTFAVHGPLEGSHGPWPLVCSGAITGHTLEQPKPVNYESLREGFEEAKIKLFFEDSSTYFFYGPRFRSITRLYQKGREFFADLELPAEANPHGDQYFVHPCLLDGAFNAGSMFAQVLLGAGSHEGILAPTDLERFDFFAAPGERAFCRGVVHTWSKTGFEADVDIFDVNGRLCIRATGMRLAFVRTRHDPSEAELRSLLFVPSWKLIEQSSSRATQVGLWVIAGSSESLIRPIANALSELGNRVEAVLLEGREAPSVIKERLLSADIRSARGLVYVAGTERTSSDLGAAALEEARRALLVLQSVQDLDVDAQLRTVCVTRAAEARAEEVLERPEQATVWGLTRTFANENARGPVLLADLPFAATDQDYRTWASEVCAEVPHSQIMIRSGGCYVLNVEPVSEGTAETSADQAPLLRVSTEEAVALALDGRAQIDKLCWIRKPRREPGPGEVELKVEASAVNFKDLMKVTGLISDAVTRGTYLGRQLGMECVGTVTRVGPGVTRFRVGERTVATAAESFASYVTCPEAVLAPVLPGLKPEESVVYATFTTVVRALEELAALEPGETILIHSAAGALGLAAIQYAKWRGARIFATASSEAKRQYLKELGVERVANSRSLAFTDEVMEWTSGRGVDVVLNFLAGEARLQSIGLLATCGRFVDVGKPGGVRGVQFPARLFNTNMQFANVDLDQLLRDAPHKMKRLAARVMVLFAEGHFEALPTKVFAPDDVQAAFTSMARAEHIGKVVIGFRDQQVTLAAQKAPLLKSARCYLVTGAFSGFGLSVCRWLVARGARHLVMVGRRGVNTPGAAKTIADLKLEGASVSTVAADVGDATAMRELVQSIEQSGPPLAGILHAAMVLDDGLISAMNEERLARSLWPKASGAWALHTATEGCALDFFVLFSSISSALGSVGQSNYAAANGFLDAFAAYRRGRGLSAHVINWGVLAESGVVAQSKDLVNLLKGYGMTGLTDNEALGALELILRNHWGHTACLKLDWDFLSAIEPEAITSPFIQQIVKSARRSSSSAPKGLLNLIEQLRDGTETKHQELVEAAVATLAAQVLRTAPDALERRRPLSLAGVDSLMATELSVVLLREYGVRFSVFDLLRTLSIAEIAAQLLSKIEQQL